MDEGAFLRHRCQFLGADELFSILLRFKGTPFQRSPKLHHDNSNLAPCQTFSFTFNLTRRYPLTIFTLLSSLYVPNRRIFPIIIATYD